MNWWKRLTGRQPEPAAAGSFPRRIEVIPDALAMTVFEHVIPTAGEPVECWTFVSDGFLALGHKELVCTIARARESLEATATGIAKLLATIRGQAAAGRLVDVGSVTIFGGTGPGGAHGLAYLSPQPLPEVELPVSALCVIPLMAAEAEIAHRFGVLRIMGRLAAHYRYYPCPPWWHVGRSAVAMSLGDESSILTRLALGRVPGFSARLDRERGVVMRVHPSSQEMLLQALAAAPRQGGFGLLLDLDGEADGLFVWAPGVEGMQAATPPGSHGARCSLCFIGFAVGVNEIRVAVVEDGALVSCTAEAWESLADAVRVRAPLRLAPTGGDLGLALEWVRTSYVSPIDGRTYASEGQWRTFAPDGPAPAPRVLDGIVLLTAEERITERTTVEALGAYLDAVENEFTRRFGGREIRTEIRVRIELVPDASARIAGAGDLDEESIVALIAAVPAPAVRHGPVAFEFRLCSHPEQR